MWWYFLSLALSCNINPLLNLCHLLSSRPGLTTLYTIIVTEEWHEIFGSDPKPDNIRFATIPSPEELEPEPSDTEMAKQFDRLPDTMELQLKFIIADVTLGRSTFDVANRRNIPVAAYWLMSASTLSFLHHMLTSTRHLGNEGTYDLSQTRLSRMLLTPKITSLFPLDTRAKCLVLTTTYELQGDAVDETVNTLIYLCMSLAQTYPISGVCHQSKPPGSVLYISLGSLVQVSNNQIAEVLAGLKQSGVTFLWAAGGETSLLSDDDYGSDGLVVEWCDQLRPEGIVTFFGWNSTKEGLFSGVPLLTFPLQGDEAFNSKLIYEGWKVGRKLKTCSNAFVSREVVKDVVREFMGLEGDSRASLMERVKHVEGICRQSVEEVGKEIDSFIRESETNWLQPTSNPCSVTTFVTSALASTDPPPLVIDYGAN
ncbi:putative UDP-glucuronosyl/UDP-glucosyltransferase [Helianthus anomalus]